MHLTKKQPAILISAQLTTGAIKICAIEMHRWDRETESPGVSGPFSERVAPLFPLATDRIVGLTHKKVRGLLMRGLRLVKRGKIVAGDLITCIFFFTSSPRLTGR